MERLFNLDAQLLFDACVMALSMLVMFTFLSYLLFKPVRKLLEDRKQRVADEQESAKNDRKEAAVYKEEYEQKLKEIDKEAQAILLSLIHISKDSGSDYSCCYCCNGSNINYSIYHIKSGGFF